MLTNNEIGERIKLARIDRGLTLNDVAKVLGMNKSTIQRYESGAVDKIKLPVLEALAMFLCVNPAWLIGNDANKFVETKNYSTSMLDFSKYNKIKFTKGELEKITTFIDFIINQRDK